LIKSKASLLYLSVANNKLTGPISADYAMMSKMTTFGVAFNQFTGPVYKIITALPQLTVIYARGNSFSGVLPPPGAAAAVYDMDNNDFTEFPADFCKQPLPGAYKNSGGCVTDWPAQPFDTCCASGNALLQCPAGSDTAPACLSNCAVSCVSTKGIIVGTWNDLSTFIAKLKKGASALYILSKGFSTPQATFKTINITKGIVKIDGGGHAILDGRGTSHMFIIEGGTLIVKGVTLQNGYDFEGGAVAVYGGSATFSSCSFVKNTANFGGAVSVDGSATFSSCSFVSNTAGEYGGAVWVETGGSARIVNCSFEADGSGTDSEANGVSMSDVPHSSAKVTFGCPTGTTGADVPMPGSDLGTSQLPPAKQIVSCH
jgi:predicted outer membrane repeat protein